METNTRKSMSAAGAGLCALLLFAGCAGETFAPENAPQFTVIRDSVPFYRYGPAQAGRPEAELSRMQRVRQLRKEMGYSLVQLEDGRVGYVANEDMAAAPPEMRAAETMEAEGAEMPPRVVVDDAPLPPE